jgi:tetratricopeptide (TPR) repeat protein
LSTSHGHDPGHHEGELASASAFDRPRGFDRPRRAFDWEAYVDWLVDTEGSLTAAADRLSGQRGYKEDVATVERALRRLRHRGSRDGGVWGKRALETFGVPQEVSQRLEWMATYHSRFTDLPVPLCADLVRAWDRPPLNGSRTVQAWLALAHASIALRRADLPAAIAHLDAARPALAAGSASVRLEEALVRAYVASRDAPDAVPGLLDAAEALAVGVIDGDARACFLARIADHRGYARGKETPPDHAGAEALYRAIPEADAPPFARSRRESGIAYACWKGGRRDEALAHAREAVRHAGDGGHLRLRVMALGLLAQIASGEEARTAHERAVAIARRLDDETLRFRLARRAPP